MADIEKLPLTTLDIPQAQLDKLKELFPEVFTEGDKIDFDRLRATLGDNVDDGPERFGLTWPGKRDCFRLIQEPSTGTLLPVEKESVNWDTTQNLFIEADNLEALKLLQKSYYGKVKMIYIDPPYNTGKDFIYPDRYAENLQTYLAYTGQASDEGYRFTTNPDTDGRFHSRWLNMMYPRLFLAKNLLRDDGVIFVSIDDAEVNNLKALMNEIFGEENTLGTIIWKKKTNGNNMGHIPPVHDYIVAYAKNALESPLLGFKLSDEYIQDTYKNPDNDSRGPWTTMDMSANHKGPYFPIENPGTGQIFYPPKGRYWVFNETEVARRINEGRIIFGKTGTASPVQKVFLFEKELKRRKAESWWDKHGMNEDGTKELSEIFDNPKVFEHSKPSILIKNLIEISSEGNDVIVDFFAGSCPTAQALFTINKEDRGNRKFILIQLPEPAESDSEAVKEGFTTIAEIGKERIRRVINKINDERQGLKREIAGKESWIRDLEKEEIFIDGAKYAGLFGIPEKVKNEEIEKRKKQIGEANNEIVEIKTALEKIESLDLGFRVFRLGESNFKVWDGDLEKEDLGRQLEMALDYVRPGRSDQDMLFELLIKSGFPLTTPVERLTIEGKTVWSVAEGSMLVCLERPLTQEVIRAMAAKEPPRVVVLDAGFMNNDPLKTNAVQIMRSHGVEDFRTV